MGDNKGSTEANLSMDVGTEGATTGYMTSGKTESLESDREPDDTSKVDEDEVVSDDEIKDEDDEKEPDDDKEPPEDDWEAREKELLRAYTTKFRELSKKKGMIELMEQIEANPKEMLPMLAQRYGVDFGSSEKAPASEPKVEMPDLSNIQPQQDETMPAYINRVFAKGMAALMEQIPKVIKAGTAQPPARVGPPDRGDPVGEAIATLDKKHEDWPLYEDDMIKLLREKPALITEPEMLYELARKESNIFKLSRKISRTKKIEGKKKFSSGARGSGTRKSAVSSKRRSFADAWEQAKVDVLRRK